MNTRRRIPAWFCTSVILALSVTMLLAPACAAGTRWTSGGVGVRSLPSSNGNATAQQVVSDGAGGAIIVWEDARSGTLQIYAQRVSSSGNRLWATDGVAVRNDPSSGADSPQLAADGAGGAIIAWHDTRSGLEDIYAQRIDSSGAAMWAANGVSVRGLGAFGPCRNPRVVSDNLLGAIVSWEETSVGNFGIYAQRISPSDGSSQWIVGGNVVRSASASEVRQTRMVSDGSHGAILAWGDYRSGTKFDVYAQKIDKNGSTASWGSPDGVPVRTVAAADAESLAMSTDGSGGALISWSDGGGGPTDRVFVQKVRYDGARIWTADGVNVRGGAPGRGQFPSVMPDGQQGAYLAWNDWGRTSMREDIYVQEVSQAGACLWGTGIAIRAVSDRNAYFPVTATDGLGGMVVTWMDYRSDTSWSIYAQRVGPAGTTLWDAQGMAVRTPPIAGDATSPVIVSDMKGGVIVAWYDQRSGVKLDLYAQRVSCAPPAVYSAATSAGAGAGAVNAVVSGKGFSTAGGSPTVRLTRSGQPSVTGTGVNVTSTTSLSCSFNLAGKAPGAWDLTVTNADGQSGTKAGAVTVNPCSTWYLAEGSNRWGFHTYMTIENGNATALDVDVTYMPSEGAGAAETVRLPALSQTTLTTEHLVSVMGGEKDFSTRVVSRDPTRGIAVDRTMAWTGQGAASEEAHNSVGVNAASATWYLPEGSSAWGFESWLLIQNPGTAQATCRITYMIEGEGPREFTRGVPAGSRSTFGMYDDIGSKDASIKVESDRAVIAERAMYRHERREGHESIGTTTPATDYFLAEGCTGFGYTTYVLVQNPNAAPVDVDVTFMTGAGPVTYPRFNMPANSRKTINVNSSVSLPDPNFSTRVHGSSQVIAERAMYWNGGPDAGEACHDSIGMPQAHRVFYLPDGETSNGRETWTLVQNPNDTAVSVKIDYLAAGGTGNQSFTDTIAANSRKSYDMKDKVASGRASVMVTCTTAGKAVMVERAMYWNSRGAGTDTIGGYSD